MHMHGGAGFHQSVESHSPLQSPSLSRAITLPLSLTLSLSRSFSLCLSLILATKPTGRKELSTDEPGPCHPKPRKLRPPAVPIVRHVPKCVSNQKLSYLD